MLSPTIRRGVAACSVAVVASLSLSAIVTPAVAADPAGALGSVVINEFSTNGWNNDTDFIELHNKGTRNVDLTGYHLTDEGAFVAADDVVLAGTLPAGGFAVIFPGAAEYGEGGFGLGRSDEVHLLSPDTATVIDSYVDLPAETHAAPSFARTVDGTGSFAQAAAATPGGSNVLSAAAAAVTINEYSSEPTDFIEIVNSGLTQVDLTGWKLADGEGAPVVGDEIILGGDVAVLDPGEFLSIRTQATPPPGVTFVSGGFGLNMRDNVYLFDASNALVSRTWVGFGADGISTRHATPSWARIGTGFGLWKFSTAATEGAANSFTTGGGGTGPTLDANWNDIEINEMASLNADDPGNPGFGDAVELVNKGTSPVSIEGWYQTDSGAASGAVALSLADLKVWNGTALVPASSWTIPAGGYVAFSSKRGLSGEGDSVKVYGPGADALSRQLVDVASYGDGDGGVSDNYDSDSRAFAACPDASDEFWRVLENSFGRSNTASCEDKSRRLNSTVVVNEVANLDGLVELLNTGTGAVDISGWELVDSTSTVVHTVPAATSVAPGAFYVATGVTGLDSADSITLRRPDGAALLAHTWYEDGIASYSRCELFGELAYVETPAATFGAANACPSLNTTAWPGASTITIGDAVDAFTDLDANDEGDVSGAAFDPNHPTVLWVVMNKGRLFKMRKVNGIYEAFPEYAGGVPLRFADGGGELDSEGVTVGPDGAVYVTSERDNLRARSTSYNKIARYDVSTVSTSTTELVATHEWDVNSIVKTGTNLGLEGITYVPDNFLAKEGWKSSGRAYTPASHKTPGLFAVAVEGTGDLHFFSLALRQGAGPVLVKTEKSGFPFAMDVTYDADRKALWALCDDSCGGVYNLLEVVDGDFTVTASYNRPADMPNLNNEGMAIAPRSTCVDGFQEVVWTDDGDTDGFSLRIGSLPCPVVTKPAKPTKR